MKIHEILEMNANKYPQKTALVMDEIEKTFAEINAEANAVGNALLEVGIRPKDKVATLFFNEPDIILSYFALLKIGVQVVPINFRLAGPEMEYILNHSECTALIYGRDFEETVGSIKKNAGTVKNYISNAEKKAGGITLKELLRGNGNQPKVKVDSDDYSYLMYTSGTTGRPKGVMITHRNTVWNSLSLMLASEARHEDVVLNPMPLFHAGALNRYQAFLVRGSTFISMKNFDAETMLKLIEKYRVTYLCMVPAMANMIYQVKNYQNYDRSSVREALVTAAITPVEVKKRILQLFPNGGLLDGYGLTEATSCGTYLKPSEAFNRPTSVGLPYPFNEARIVNDQGKDVVTGEIGEIIIKGPNVMQGYYKDPTATQQTLRGGWLYTGDLGRKDDEGYFYIVDRKKDMIISGGENIYPAEVESLLNSHPKILETAVIGVKDAKWGESVLALIVLKQGETATKEEIDQYCLKNIARYKRPRQIRFLESLPRNPSGKVLKTELRETFGNAISY